MQKIILSSVIALCFMSLGAALDRYVLSPATKTSETSISDDKNKTTDTDKSLTSEINTNEKQKGHEEIKRKTETKPDGTTIVSEDIVRDFWAEKTAKENSVLVEKVKQIENEKVLLTQKISEFRKPEYAITLFPAYNFNTERIIYGFAIQKRVFADCYLGVSLDKERLAIPFTCNF